MWNCKVCDYLGELVKLEVPFGCVYGIYIYVYCFCSFLRLLAIFWYFGLSVLWFLGSICPVLFRIMIVWTCYIHFVDQVGHKLHLRPVVLAKIAKHDSWLIVFVGVDMLIPFVSITLDGLIVFHLYIRIKELSIFYVIPIHIFCIQQQNHHVLNPCFQQMHDWKTDD